MENALYILSIVLIKCIPGSVLLRFVLLNGGNNLCVFMKNYFI